MGKGSHLQLHNDFRRQQGASNMAKLEWDASLEASAQNWTDQCPSTFEDHYMMESLHIDRDTSTTVAEFIDHAMNTFHSQKEFYHYGTQGSCRQNVVCEYVKPSVKVVLACVMVVTSTMKSSLGAMEPWARDRILQLHNDFRRQQGASNMAKLEWDASLEASAQNWTDQCPSTFEDHYMIESLHIDRDTSTTVAEFIDHAMNTFHSQKEFYHYGTQGSCRQNVVCEYVKPTFHQARLPCGAIAQTVAWSAPRSMALHSITASQCAFTQPPPADGPAFPPATSRPAVGSGQRPPLIQASCPTSYH
ncbi:hypothetical protein ACOMHN_058690 [Nucella lapillus]